MKFTIENQQDNKITKTTVQTIKHFIYANNEVSISGINGAHSVWHKQGKRMSQKIKALSISEAVDFANKLINNI
tara:strand:- start:34 stop:255 length:222 start_codon:yes stop_codon:yes gene_type:complete